MRSLLPKYKGLIHSIDVVKVNVILVFGRLNLFALRIRGISLKGIPLFFGRPIIKKYPGSELLIGFKAKFVSRNGYNMIGINRPCIITTLSPTAKLTIGDNCGFSGTVIGCFDEIIIGNDVKCGANTLITDSDWHQEDNRSGKNKPIILHDNVWLGEGVKVLKGVTIGKNSLIGAGSVVVSSIPANVIAAGNPCKVIRTIEK